MNTRILAAAALVIAATGSAWADDITVDTTPFASQKSRAEVQAELQQYKRTGINPWSTQYNPLRHAVSQKARANVVAETRAAVASGEIAAYTGEDSGALHAAARTAPARSTTLVAQSAR